MVGISQYLGYESENAHANFYTKSHVWALHGLLIMKLVLGILCVVLLTATVVLYNQKSNSVNKSAELAVKVDSLDKKLATFKTAMRYLEGWKDNVARGFENYQNYNESTQSAAMTDYYVTRLQTCLDSVQWYKRKFNTIKINLSY